MKAISVGDLDGRLLSHVLRHDGGCLVRVATCEGIKVARALRTYADGVAVTLRGPPPDYCVVE
jgi:hypothetical protein